MTEEQDIVSTFKRLINEPTGKDDREFVKVFLPEVSSKEFEIIYGLGKIRGQQQILRELGA